MHQRICKEKKKKKKIKKMPQNISCTQYLDKVYDDLYVFQGKSCFPRSKISHAIDYKRKRINRKIQYAILNG
jgi:hypothetical protein